MDGMTCDICGAGAVRSNCYGTRCKEHDTLDKRIAYFHTGKYDLATDSFKGGRLAAFGPRHGFMIDKLEADDADGLKMAYHDNERKLKLT